MPGYKKSTTSALLGAAAVLSAATANAALAEPPANQAILGLWFQSDPGYQETPGQLNERTGLKWPIFQSSQPIPVPRYDFNTGVGGPFPGAYIEATGTDADYYLTVYPNQGLNAVTDADLYSLGLQIATYQSTGRNVFLRWAPEFGGNWMVYGLQPTAFKEVWGRMYTIIKQVAPQTVIVWSPNTGYSYPFGATLSQVTLQADKTALDTNRDGQLTNADDPYAPYYPGDDQVDWIGISLYYKGPNFVNQNTNQPAGFCYDLIHGGDPFNRGNGANVDWYQEYCASKPEKACMFSEAGAAWHKNATIRSDNTQVELQRAWWSDCMINTSFWEEHPRLKMYMQFEYEKFETDGGIIDDRDYRITNNTDVLNAFLSDLGPVMQNYVWANSTVPAGTPPNTTAFEVTPSGTYLATDVVISGTPSTVTYTQFYSGPFATDSSFIATNTNLGLATGTVLAGDAATSTGLAGVPGAAANTNPSVFGNSGATGAASRSLVGGASTLFVGMVGGIALALLR